MKFRWWSIRWWNWWLSAPLVVEYARYAKGDIMKRNLTIAYKKWVDAEPK